MGVRSRNQSSREQYVLRPPRAPGLFRGSTPAKDGPFSLPPPPRRQTRRTFNPNTTGTQETKPGSSECSQDPSNSHIRVLSGLTDNIFSALLPQIFPKQRYWVTPDKGLLQEQLCLLTPPCLPQVWVVLTSTLHGELRCSEPALPLRYPAPSCHPELRTVLANAFLLCPKHTPAPGFIIIYENR